MDPNDIWAIPPRPAVGDADIDTTYRAVGHALSEWERFEAHLAILFATILGLERESNTARRAYGSVVAFAGRAEMLKGAADIYFQEHPEPHFEAQFSSIYKTARRAGARRNDIAHGIVQPFNRITKPRKGWDYGLYPSYYTSKGRDLSFKPEYVYTSAEIERFARQFGELAEPTNDLDAAIFVRHRT